MITYRDTTFCSGADNCAVRDCYRRLTDEDIENANLMGLPIASAPMHEHCILFDPIDEWAI